MNNSFSVRQNGAALMAMVLVIFISASTLLFSAVRPPSDLDANDSRTYEELGAAKAALIAFATNYASYNNDGLGPGRLPCPAPWTETVNGEERWTPYWNGCNWKYVLRLPEFVSLPAPYSFDFPINEYYAERDLQFWYAISRPYRWYKGSYPSVNTTTGAELTIDGDPYVAVIIAPGPALDGQDRQAAENYSSNYYGATENLEGTNAYWGPGTFQSFDASSPEDFNDVVIGITQSELMTPVTGVVATEIKKELDAYHPTNGDSYPTDPQFSTAIASIASWYAGDEWDTVTTYSYLSANQATVSFSQCDILYTLDFTSGISRVSQTTPNPDPYVAPSC